MSAVANSDRVSILELPGIHVHYANLFALFQQIDKLKTDNLKNLKPPTLSTSKTDPKHSPPPTLPPLNPEDFKYISVFQDILYQIFKGLAWDDGENKYIDKYPAYKLTLPIHFANLIAYAIQFPPVDAPLTSLSSSPTTNYFPSFFKAKVEPTEPPRVDLKQMRLDLLTQIGLDANDILILEILVRADPLLFPPYSRISPRDHFSEKLKKYLELKKNTFKFKLVIFFAEKGELTLEKYNELEKISDPEREYALVFIMNFLREFNQASGNIAFPELETTTLNEFNKFSTKDLSMIINVLQDAANKKAKDGISILTSRLLDFITFKRDDSSATILHPDAIHLIQIFYDLVQASTPSVPMDDAANLEAIRNYKGDYAKLAKGIQHLNQNVTLTRRTLKTLVTPLSRVETRVLPSNGTEVVRVSLDIESSASDAFVTSNPTVRREHVRESILSSSPPTHGGFLHAPIPRSMVAIRYHVEPEAMSAIFVCLNNITVLWAWLNSDELQRLIDHFSLEELARGAQVLAVHGLFAENFVYIINDKCFYPYEAARALDQLYMAGIGFVNTEHNYRKIITESTNKKLSNGIACLAQNGILFKETLNCIIQHSAPDIAAEMFAVMFKWGILFDHDTKQWKTENIAYIKALSQTLAEDLSPQFFGLKKDSKADYQKWFTLKMTAVLNPQLAASSFHPREVSSSSASSTTSSGESSREGDHAGKDREDPPLYYEATNSLPPAPLYPPQPPSLARPAAPAPSLFSRFLPFFS